MPSIFLNYPSDSACVYHRLIEPARFCHEDWARVGCHIHVGEGVPDGYDWIGFTGLPTGPGFQAIMQAKVRGTKLLWSVDDDYHTIPPWSPAHRGETDLVWHRAMKQNADLILCSTDHLASTFDDVREKVVVAPNLCDISRFPSGPQYDQDERGRPKAAFTVNLPIKVMWSGSVTHRGDVDVIEPVVHHLARRFSERELKVIYFGMTPPPSVLREHLHKTVVYQSPVAFGDYRKTVNTIRPDVWLAPLADIPFNLSKSNLRVMEGWALSAAVCASAVGEYRCVHSGEDGRLCHDEDSWVSAVSRLVGDHQHRLDLACAGRRRVEQDFSWHRRENRGAWDAVFSRVFGVEPPG